MRKTKSIYLLMMISMMSFTHTYAQSKTLAELVKSGDYTSLSNMMAEEIDLCIMDDTQINTKEEAITRIKSFVSTNPISNYEVLHKGKSDANASRYNVYKLMSNSKAIRAFVYFEEDGTKSWIKEIRFDKFN